MKIKVLTPEETILLWPSRLERAFIEILSHSRHDDTLVSVLRNILNSKLLVWIYYDNDFHICGLSTTKIIQSDNEKSLVIDHVWASEKYVSPFKETKEGMRIMENYARAMKCDNIKTYSILGEKYFKIMGFTPSYTEYIKEIKLNEDL
jgi:hypothetical protein